MQLKRTTCVRNTIQTIAIERQNQIKIDFEALNFSRISNEARKQITEIVKQDLENKIKEIEKNTPEINEDTKSEADFMYNWIREKSGKK